MAGRNVLFIMSDEHSRRVVGAYGNEIVRTPSLDAMARSGTTFENAYCNSPICVPSRASFATGRHVHEIGSWDNAHPYDGAPPSWAHRLNALGHPCDSIGKLHYRRTGAHNGFRREILPLHVPNGEGDIQGLARRPPVRRHPASAWHLAREAGPGITSYHAYDRSIRDEAIGWLEREAERPSDRGWCLFVSFVCPHFPLVAPQEFYDLYDPADLPMPGLRDVDPSSVHPVVRGLREAQDYDAYFESADDVRRALTAYYGLVSFLDDSIGRILETLAGSGLDRETLVVYSSDHGDNLGTRGLWGKLTLYEESAGIPLILTGPGVPAGHRVRTPVSLVDAAPTILETVAGLSDPDLPGRSLTASAELPDEDRTVLCEYHGPGSMTGCLMVRYGRYKYIHYDGFEPELFDLESDPFEARNLAASPAHGAALQEGERRLRAICDPRAVTARAFADQARLIERYGGEAAVRARSGFPFTPAPGEAARVT